MGLKARSVVPRTKKRTVSEGDVFATILDDGRYGAIRVLKILGKSKLVATTPYIDNDPPRVDDPRLGAVLRRNSFSWHNEEALCVYDGGPPNQQTFVGNVPLRPAELGLEIGALGMSYGGKWSAWVGQGVYQEWRWEHDREALEEENRRARAESERKRRLQPTPGKMLSESKFWRVIAALDWDRTGDDAAVLSPAVELLSKMSDKDIAAFEETFSYKLFLLDTKNHAKNIGEGAYSDESGYISADGFLYARCVVVANGPEMFASVLRDPLQMPKDLEFESLLSLGPQAYEMKTGEETEHLPGCSYESFTNRDGWK